MLEVDKIDSRLSFGSGSERHGSIPEIGSQTALQCENYFKTVCDVIPGMDPWELGLGSNDLQNVSVGSEKFSARFDSNTQG